MRNPDWIRKRSVIELNIEGLRKQIIDRSLFVAYIQDSHVRIIKKPKRAVHSQSGTFASPSHSDTRPERQCSYIERENDEGQKRPAYNKGIKSPLAGILRTNEDKVAKIFNHI